MRIMFIRVVCGRIILRCLIVKTIIFDKCLFIVVCGAELFDVLKNGNSARLFGIMLHVKRDLFHCRILLKE